MSTKTLKIPDELRREAIVERASEGGNKKTFTLSLSSDVPYKRRDWGGEAEFYWEVLDHGPGGLKEDRLKAAGLPILWGHDTDQPLAVAKTYHNDGHRLTVTDLVWSSSDFAQTKKKDAESGALPYSSVGYRILGDGVCEGAKDGYPIYRFAWEINEGSLVSVPADTSVGPNRERENESGTKFIEVAVRMKDILDDPQTKDDTRPQSMNTLPAVRRHFHEADKGGATGGTTAEAPQVNVIKERGDAVTAERKRVSDIQALVKHFADVGCMGRKVDTRDLAAKAIADGASERDFQDAVVRGNPPTVESIVIPEVGMSKKEKGSFSFLRAIYGLGTGRGLQGLEKEASEAHAKLLGKECGPSSFYVPEDVMRGRAFQGGRSNEEQIRALFSNVYSGAGAFVGTDLMGASLIELLRNQMLVVQMGARSMGGLRGNVAIPRQTGGATASWLAEDSTITATQQTVGQLNLTPHKLAAATAFTEQLAMQTSVDAENFVRQDLMAVTAIARDLGALAGTGVSGQPVGILNLGSTNLSTPVTLSAAQSMTYANAVKFELNVSLNNANRGKLGYLASPTVKNNAKLIAEIASTNSTPVWKDDRVNGYPALATNQIPTATSVIFGNWDDLILADWADSNFFVDPYSLSLQGQIRVINRLYCDNGVRHGTSFAISVG